MHIYLNDEDGVYFIYLLNWPRQPITKSHNISDDLEYATTSEFKKIFLYHTIFNF